MAFCVKSNQGNEFRICQEKCEEYSNPRLCAKNDGNCWDSCRDLPVIQSFKTSGNQLKSVENIISESDSEYNIQLFWNPVPQADFYEVSYHPADNPSDEKTLTVAEPFVKSIQLSQNELCFEWSVQIRAVSGELGIGPLSVPTLIPSPRPRISPRLKLISMVFDKSPDDETNGIITVIFGYSSDWPLTDTDLDVIPVFHMSSCALTDITQTVPAPDFHKGSNPYTIQTKFGADIMYRRCKFSYSVQEVHSKQCDVSNHLHPQTNDYGNVQISCDNVENSDCQKSNLHPGPICGQIDNFNYNLIDMDNIDWGNKNSKISINISFVPYLRPINEKKFIYYVALYGDAQPYDSSQEESLLGVKMTEISGKASNCLNLTEDNDCRETTPNSIVLTNLTMDKLYGVMICGVVDPKNLTFPSINVINKVIKIKSDKILINSSDYKTSGSNIVGIVVGIISFILIAMLLFVYRCHKNVKRTRKLADLEKQCGNEARKSNVSFFKKDLWELERNDLTIYEDEKLGSGTFGAVYFGKLIGKAEATRDAKSALGANLMKVENCPVAVKILSEDADEICKLEFFQEIELMKKLGYHERLVNMMACITESEPYCLVVEYCSDGDLLHFLRQRCEYMLKLDEQNIDYSNPYGEYDIDVEMIMTVKQLLMFAVQISCGLEYLAQKGFVHRDIAAKNILVHEKSSAKIGDFGLCRYIHGENPDHTSRGGGLPIKWMSPEAIRNYEFTTKSDVWSFGILMFEIITLGGIPYPGIQRTDMLKFLDSGNRIPQPDNCPDEYYAIMKSCWAKDPEERPDFSSIRNLLALQLEDVTEEYSYLKLDGGKDYYSVYYRNQKKAENQTAGPSDSDLEDSEVESKKSPMVFETGLAPNSELEENSKILDDTFEDVLIEYESPTAVYAVIEKKDRSKNNPGNSSITLESNVPSNSVQKNKPKSLEEKSETSQFRSSVPPKTDRFGDSFQQELGQNDSGVSAEFDSDDTYLSPKRKDDFAFKNNSSQMRS